MNGLTLRQMEYFLAVVETGNLAAAAERLHVTPGTLSSAITVLEKELGIQLLTRQPSKGSTVSTAGRAIEPKIRDALTAVREVTTTAESIRSELVGPLSVGCFDTLVPWLLPAVLDFFATKHPRVDVDITQGSSNELQSRLRSNTLDVAFMYTQHVDKALDHEQITPVRLQLVLPAGHRLAGRESVRFKELGNEPAILLGLWPALDNVLNTMAEAGFTPNVRWTFNDVEVIRSLVGRGLGYSVLMGRPRGDTSYEGRRLAYCRIADPLQDNAVELVYCGSARSDAKVQALRAFAKRELSRSVHPMQSGQDEKYQESPSDPGPR